MNLKKRLPNLRPLLDAPFLVALTLLLINDHFWKAAYHNGLTGILSDFAGLYAFAWVGMTVWPQTRHVLPWLVALAFCLWKSPLSQPMIDGWNEFGPFFIHRVVDPLDLLALSVLPLAAWRFGRQRETPSAAIPQTAGQWAVLGIAIFAFIATSQLDRFEFKESYSFKLTPQQLIDQLNALNRRDTLYNATLSMNHQNANDFRQEGDIRLYLHHNKEVRTAYDTLYAKIDDSVFIDRIDPYEVPEIDSMYVNPDGIFEWSFDARPENIPDTAFHCGTLPAILKLQATKDGCRLDLLVITVGNCREGLNQRGDKSEIEFLKSLFELHVVQPLRKAENAGL